MRWGEAEVDGFDGLMAAKRESICFGPLPLFLKRKKIPIVRGKETFLFFLFFF